MQPVSWGLKVPECWVPGEPIRFMGTGPRYACFVARNPWEPMAPYGIKFDNREDADKFRDWWYAGRFELTI